MDEDGRTAKVRRGVEEEGWNVFSVPERRVGGG